MTEMHAPRLEMLWEASDPSDALATRFGFSDGAEASRWVAMMLDKKWGIRVNSCDRIVISDTNALAWVDTSSGRMLMKWSIAPARFPRLAAVARLTAWLGEEGLPVSALVVTLYGRVQVEADGASLGLQRQINGDLLDINQSTQVRAAGAVLAQLHDALAIYPDAGQVPELAAPSSHLADPITGWLDSCPEQVPGRYRRRHRFSKKPAPIIGSLSWRDQQSCSAPSFGTGGQSRPGFTRRSSTGTNPDDG